MRDHCLQVAAFSSTLEMASQYSQWSGSESTALYPLENQLLLGGHSMAANGRTISNTSSISMSSNSTYSSCDCPSTSCSHYSGSPTEHEAYSPYQTPLADEIENRDYLQFSAKHQQSYGKSTPRSLGWTHPSHWLPLYKFVVKHNGKERYLELLPGLPVYTHTPSRVDLDEESNHVKGVHRCMYPGGCKGKQDTFGRPADLDRHYMNVHADPEMKKQFRCDFPKCARAIDAFNRKDHFRDHLRDYHKEDIGCAKGANSKVKKPQHIRDMDQAQWLQERKIQPHYWRCSKCLDCIMVAKHGWECPRCNTACESSRVDARRTITPRAESVDDVIAEETLYMTSMINFPACMACTGNGWIDDNNGSWVQCLNCTQTQSTYYDENSFSDNRWG